MFLLDPVGWQKTNTFLSLVWHKFCIKNKKLPLNIVLYLLIDKQFSCLCCFMLVIFNAIVLKI